MDVVKQAGSGIGKPEQTVNIQRGERKDGEQARTAEEQVSNWRRNNAMYIPLFLKTKLKNCAPLWIIYLGDHQGDNSSMTIKMTLPESFLKMEACPLFYGNTFLTQ
jgi:hypothetical protein